MSTSHSADKKPGTPRLIKSIVKILLALLCIGAVIATFIYLYQTSQKEPVVFETESLQTRTIVVKTIATGKIMPRREVEIKPQVSGVVDQLFTVAGNAIRVGEIIARIRIIPNIEQLNNAEARLLSAEISFADAKRERERQRKLYEDNLIPEIDYRRFDLDFQLKREALNTAKSNLAIIRQGATDNPSSKTALSSTEVASTLDGMVLDIPVKVGTFITETNNFNPGTTIALVANMEDLIFEGLVDEAEVGKIREGMQLDLDIGALQDKSYRAILEFISPKGQDDEGTIKFLIKASVQLPQGEFLRAGYSANANIVLAEKTDVLAIDEKLLQFEQGNPFVEIETAPQVFEKRSVTLGISDGLYAEVIDGIDEGTRIKVPKLILPN